MHIDNLPSSMTDWSTLPASEHPGESGLALVRTRQFGEIQLRLVEYSASYVGDHWCNKGHLIYVIAGQLVIEHEDGGPLLLPAGTSYHVGDDERPAHRARSDHGATVFIVD
ncbi:MAG: hypothetical protein B7X34_01515 [Acidobacteriia bacterium 12-62-4]|nr:MAG: hypothetical protein B7X34_01515 [Acidobacteriia bacterium 12-62-4]